MFLLRIEYDQLFHENLDNCNMNEIIQNYSFAFCIIYAYLLIDTGPGDSPSIRTTRARLQGL